MLRTLGSRRREGLRWTTGVFADLTAATGPSLRSAPGARTIEARYAEAALRSFMTSVCFAYPERQNTRFRKNGSMGSRSPTTCVPVSGVGPSFCASATRHLNAPNAASSRARAHKLRSNYWLLVPLALSMSRASAITEGRMTLLNCQKETSSDRSSGSIVATVLNGNSASSRSTHTPAEPRPRT